MSILEPIRLNLVHVAERMMMEYPQYRGHFEKYELVRVRKAIKTKMWLAFDKGQLAVASPEISVVVRPNGKVEEFITVFSEKNRGNTSIPRKHIDILTGADNFKKVTT